MIGACTKTFFTADGDFVSVEQVAEKFPAGGGFVAVEPELFVDAVGGYLLGELANEWNGGGDALPVGQLSAGGGRVGRTTAWLADPGRSPSTIPLSTSDHSGTSLP